MASSVEDNMSFGNISEYLRKFRGGSIIMERDEEKGIATLCFENPTKKNAISGVMMLDLRDHLLSLEQWPTGKAVILYGKGNFCSGGDLDFALKSGNLKGAQYISKWMQDTLMRLHRLPMISVCLLSGPSLGGGAEIAIFCDYLIASDDVSYGFVHGKLDIIPAYGGGSRLIQKLGYEEGLNLLLTSKILKANECFDIGLVEKIVPTGTAYEDTIEWALQKIKHHYSVTRALKQVAVNAKRLKLEEALTFERNLFCSFWGSERNKIALRNRIKHL